MHGAMLRLLTPLTTPTTHAGSWEPGDRERAAAQNEQEAPDPIFALDNVYVEDEHIDASPPYFIRAALAVPRSRTGLHLPNYDRHDPFTALRRNSIPFPTQGRRYVPPVPFGQWPDESDASDSSTESFRGQQQQQDSNPAGTTQEPARTWNTTSPRTGGAPFHFGTPYRRGNHGQGPRQPKSGTLWSPSRPPMPDLRARTGEEECLLQEQLERLALQLDEQLWREDNSQ